MKKMDRVCVVTTTTQKHDCQSITSENSDYMTPESLYSEINDIQQSPMSLYSEINDIQQSPVSLYSEINDIQQERTIEICQNLTNEEATTDNEYITCIQLDSETEVHKILTFKRKCTIASAVVGVLVLALVLLSYGVYHFQYFKEINTTTNLTSVNIESFKNHTTGLDLDIGPGHSKYVTTVKSVEKATCIPQSPVTSHGNCNKPKHGRLKIDLNNLFKKGCTRTKTNSKFGMSGMLSSINHTLWLVYSFNLQLFSFDLELKQHCKMNAEMRLIRQAHNGDLIVIGRTTLFKMDRVCEHLEAIDERSYVDLCVHGCNFYVLFYEAVRGDRHYKIRKFSHTTHNNMWNCVEEIKFQALDPQHLKMSSLLIYQDHFYVAKTRKDVSSIVKYSMTGNLIENVITFENKSSLTIYAVDITGKFLTTEDYNSYRKGRLVLVAGSLLKRLNKEHLMDIKDVEIDDNNNLWISGFHHGHGYKFNTLSKYKVNN